MADEFFFDESNPDCRLPKIPRPPVDFVPECFIEPPPPPIFECILPVPLPDPPPFRCPEFETTSTVDVFYEDPECEEKTTKIELKFTKVNDDPCEFEVDLDVQIGIPRPPCPTLESEHKTHVGYEDCIECTYVGSVGSAAEVDGLTENSFSLPEPEDGKFQPVFVTLRKVVTQVIFDGEKFNPYFDEEPFASLDAVLAGGAASGTVATPTPFFKFDSGSGKWLPVTAPVESAAVKTFSELATIPVADAPAGTILRVKDSNALYERLPPPNSGWSLVTFNPVDFTDETGKVLTLNDLVNANTNFPTGAIVRVKLTGTTFGVVNGQLVEVEKAEPDDWVFEEADLPAYLETKKRSGASLTPGTIVGIAFPTDRYELLPIRSGSGEGVRQTWQPARCKQNKFRFVTARPKDCADKDDGCRFFLFTEITVPIPRQPCPEFDIREFEVNSYIDRPGQEDSVCGRKTNKFVIEKKPDDPTCETPNNCEFNIDLVIDVPIPEIPCPEIEAKDVVVNTVFISEEDEELDPLTCCPLPGGIIEVATTADRLDLTRREADVGSVVKQTDTGELWERIGPLLYIDNNGDDDFDNIDEPGKPEDWRILDPCGSRLSVKTIKKEGNCQKPDECRFEVDLRINVPVPRIPCPEVISTPPTVTTGFDDAPCVTCSSDLTVDTVEQMYAIPSEHRNYGMYVEIKVVANAFAVGEDAALIPISVAPSEPDFKFDNWGDVPGQGNQLPPVYNEDGSPVEDVPPWEREEGAPPRVQNGTVISLKKPAEYFIAVDSETRYGVSKHRWLPLENYNGSPDRVTTFASTSERDQYFTANPVNLPFLGPAVARVPNAPSTYIYNSEPLDGPDGSGGPVGWVALNDQTSNADSVVDTVEDISRLPPADREEGDIIAVKNPATRYKLERDMITWTPAPCPKNKFEITVVSEPPKDCRDPGKCTLTFEFEINVPIPKPKCPQINVRDFTVSTYDEDDEECPPDPRPECDTEPTIVAATVGELKGIAAQDNEIAQVGRGSTGELYRYSAGTDTWSKFVPAPEDRRKCCAFNITQRNSSNAIAATVETIEDLNALLIPDDVEPGEIVVVLYPPEERDDGSQAEGVGDPENTTPWFFRAGSPPEEASWSRMEDFDPCNPPPPECNFDVDLNICVPIPVVPCPESKSEQKTHVGYSDDECVNCDVNITVGFGSEISAIDSSQLSPPLPPPDCNKGCEQFEDDNADSGDEENPEPKTYYIGVLSPTTQFTYGENGFEPSFQERTLASFADMFAGDVDGPFTIDNLSPYFELVDGVWVPVGPPTAESTVETENDLTGLPIERVPPGSRIGVAGGGIFERQPNGSWTEVEFNPTTCGSTFADIVNGDTSCSAEGAVIEIELDPDTYYAFDTDGNLNAVAKPKPNDWIFDEESIPTYLAERAAATNPVQIGEIIAVAFPTDRYKLTVYSGGGEETRTITPARCKKNKTVLEIAKNCADRKCKIFLFTEVTVPIPRPPCPEFSAVARARGFYANGDDEPCGDCGSDLVFTSLDELTQNGQRPIGSGNASEAACKADLDFGTVAQVEPNKETGEPGSRWRWNPDYGGWQPAPCGENFVAFKKAKKPDLKTAKSKKNKSALCAKEDPGTVYFIEDTNEFYVSGSDGQWRQVSPEDCTESSCQFDVDIDLSVPIPQPPCPIFNTRKADIRVCDEFPRVSLGIGARESKCDPDEPNIQCVFDVDFDLELPCPKFYGAGTSVNMVGPDGAARGSVNFQKRCETESPKITCDDGASVEDALARDKYALEQLEMLANNPEPPEDAFGPGSIVKTMQPLPGGMTWRFLGIENGVLSWEVVPCDPEPKNICSFDVDLSIDVPACSSITFEEDDDAGTHTGIAKADRYKLYYLKADDDCPPDPQGNPCVNPDNVNIKVNNEAEKQALLGQPPGKIRRNDDPGGGAHQIRAGEVFREPVLDAEGQPTGEFNYARLDAQDPPSQQLTYTPIPEADVPLSPQGRPIARNVANYDVGTLANLQNMLGGPPDPRLVDGAAIQVGADGFGVFKINGQKGAFVPANVCGKDLFSVVIVPEKVLDNNGNPIQVGVNNGKPIHAVNQCKFRYAQQIRICQRMPDHNAPCTEYHGNPCCDTGCPCTSPPTNPCCTDDTEKESDGNYPAPSQSEEQAQFTALPRAFPVLNMADDTQGDGSAGPDPDAPGDPCEDYVAEESGGCGAASTPADPGYRPFKSIELNIKENFPEDRLTPPKITYQLDVAPNCLHGGEVKISKGKRPDDGGQTTVTPFTQLPTDPDSFDTVTASLPRLDSTGDEAYVSCVSGVIAADAIGTGTIEIVNNKINLCLTLYTDECDEDTTTSGPSSPGTTPSSSEGQPFTAAPRRALTQAAPPARLSAALLEDLILAINTHPELKEAIRNIVNQPD